MTTAYSRIDRFLRQNLNDKDYPAYKDELDAICQAKLQRTFVGLTDEEIEYVWRRVETSDFHDCVILFAKELEAKLKQKNGYAEEKNS